MRKAGLRSEREPPSGHEGGVDLGRAAARGTAFTLGAQAGRFVLQIAALVVLARLLDPDAFGLVAMATSVLGVAELVRDFGLSSAAISAKHLSDAERTNLFWLNVAIGAACALVALVGAGPIAALYGDPRVAGVVVALAGLLVVSGVTTQFRAELSRDLRFAALGVVELSAQAAGVGVAVSSAALGAGYWSIVAQQAAVVVATCVLCVGCCGWRPGLPQRATSVRRFLRFGSHVLGTQVLGYATNNVDNVGVGAVWGAGPLGVYSRAYQLLMVPINQVNDPMTRVVLPVLSRVQDDPPTLQRYVEKAQRLGTHGLGPLFAVAAGLAVPLVAVLFGPRWGAVVPVFVALAVGGVFRGVGLVTYWGFLARGRADAQLRMYLVTRPLMIGLILAGLPWGPVGVAVGHSASFALYWVVSLVVLGRVTGLDSARLLQQALVAIAVLALPVGLLAQLGTRLVDGVAPQLFVGGLLVLAWVGLLLLVLPAQRAELVAARALLRRRGVRPGSRRATASGRTPR